MPDVRSKVDPKLGARWCLDTDPSNNEVDLLTSQWADGTARTYRSTEWAKIPTTVDFDFTPLFSVRYDGIGHPVTVVPHAGIGTVQNIRYIDPYFTTLWEAPVEAGTYYVCFDVSPNDEYASVANLKFGPYIILPELTPEPEQEPTPEPSPTPIPESPIDTPSEKVKSEPVEEIRGVQTGNAYTLNKWIMLCGFAAIGILVTRLYNYKKKTNQ